MDRSKYIDHTLLKADATHDEIVRLCTEAKTYHFASACVNPGWVKTCHEILKDTDVMVAACVGFPLGATSSESKAFEAKKAVEDGASEIDMVINVGRLKSHDDEYVKDDIKAVKDAAGVTVKVIIETCLLNEEEKVRACLLAKEAGADFVKTSTGFSTGGATAKDVALMKKTVGDSMQVKASGGIRTREDMDKMIEAGATRIGTSKGIELL